MSPQPETARLTTERLNAFSDGVLAIVVTILVLNIEVPDRHLSEGAVVDFLHAVEHDLLIYAASFWLVGIYWLVHHVVTSYVHYVDTRLLWRNLLFLFAITLLPFLTKLKNAHPNSPIAAQLFGFGHITCGLSLLLLWGYVCAHPELRGHEISAETRRRIRVGLSVGCVLALLGSSVTHINARLGTYLLPLVPAAYWILLRGLGNGKKGEGR